MNSKLRDVLNSFGSDCSFRNLSGEEYKTELGKAEKAIRQAVGEEMLELTSVLERWIEYNKHDMGELGEFIRTRYAMSGLNELRQKIKQWQGGEDA